MWRRDVLRRFLRDNHIPFMEHDYKLLGATGTNLIASFGKGPEEVLVTAHYDSVPGSPGANDNASGVAVLLQLCLSLQGIESNRTIKIIFFDGEESRFRIGPVGWGLWGSSAYVRDFGTKSIRAQYNLEWCGEGDCVGLWPVDRKVKGTEAYLALKGVLDKEGCVYDSAAFPFLVVSSDHRPFRSAGITGAFTISVLPGNEMARLRHLFSHRKELFKFLLASRSGRGRWSSVFLRHHTTEDSSKHLSEKSLQLAFDVVYQTVMTWTLMPQSNPLPLWRGREA